jgi:protein-S-isoprenylcysteine O-methyltransferase Ste14
MEMNMSKAKIIVGIILIALAFLMLFTVFFLKFCQPCVGWDIINPFCHIAAAGCATMEFFVKLMMIIMGAVVFLIGLILLIWGAVSGGKRR